MQTRANAANDALLSHSVLSKKFHIVVKLAITSVASADISVPPSVFWAIHLVALNAFAAAIFSFEAIGLSIERLDFCIEH